jgi:hypothetical protein
MEILFTLILGAGVLLGLHLLASSRRSLRTGVHNPISKQASDPTSNQAGVGGVEVGLLTPTSCRERIDALAAELARLDRDPDVFAKAFHVLVARSAYRALLADAARLGEESRSAGLPGPECDQDWEGSSTAVRREVLEL